LSNLTADKFEALAVRYGEFERFDGHARQLPEHHNDYVEALIREEGIRALPEVSRILLPKEA
jgi:hypothetical protein